MRYFSAPAWTQMHVRHTNMDLVVAERTKNSAAGPPNMIPPEIKPAPNAQTGWNHAAYSALYGVQIGYYIQTHGKTAQVIQVGSDLPIDRFEPVTLLKVSGFHSSLGLGLN
jgi:hypothetical protein